MNRNPMQRGGQRQFQGPQRQQSRGVSQIPPGLSQDYLKSGYFEEDACPRREVLLDWPKDIAQRLARGMEPTQLRRFYNAARQIERKLDATGDYGCAKGDLWRLLALAQEAVKKRKAPPLFGEFMERNAREATKSEAHFRKGFLPHFECLVAYFPESRRR